MTQKKAYNIQNTAKAWNQEFSVILFPVIDVIQPYYISFAVVLTYLMICENNYWCTQFMNLLAVSRITFSVNTCLQNVKVTCIVWQVTL